MADENPASGFNVLSNNTVDTSLGIDEASKAVAPAIKTFSTLIADFLGPPAEASGALVAEVINGWRIANHLKILEGTKEKCRVAGVDPTSLPKSMLLPALEASKDIDDPMLQEMWQRLLANAAADEANRQIIFVETMKRLSPADAKVFDEFARFDPPRLAPAAINNPHSQSFTRLEMIGLVEVLITAHKQQPMHSVMGREIVRIKDVRGRVHETLLEYPSVGMTPQDHISVNRAGWRISSFGAQFHTVVTKDPIRQETKG
jgi:hypothetical protein